MAVLISGGVHGDEPAGVHAALAFLADGQREFNDVLQFVVFPCVNPSGFDAGTLETASGANLNRLFGIDSTQPEVRAIEDCLRIYARRFRMTFDLHEVSPDYVGEEFIEKDNPRAAYLYETASDESDRIGRLMIDALPSSRRICDWPTIYNDIKPGRRDFISGGMPQYDLCERDLIRWIPEPAVHRAFFYFGDAHRMEFERSS